MPEARKESAEMDLVEGLIKAALTIIALLVVFGAIAALFMFVFSIATGIDERIQS
jgi:ABC-type nickel/cobalt efflux system permease component RcnA